ncbi:hypothetical protein E5329_14165 [Petralouisia muris]|uniref:Uncharacterized protein n=1 Tax=Petralouisia muris TaxID=3032872 RepID=A0AC61RV37_9FIRM|nr:hypothetical protein [Petralouisia muris]TGY95563.1 hypothetical protein E5329_14165 [Petralouisia muris]
MNKMKKILIAAFAFVVVCGISAPVIAANMQKSSPRVEQEVTTRKAGLSNAIINTSTISPEETSEEADMIVDIQDTELADDAAEDIDAPAEEQAPVEESAPADAAAEVPDTTASPVCPYYTDANGDGVCDHCAHGGACGNYVDANGDGICDYCAHGGACGNYVDADGNGVCDYCSHNGSGHCGSYVDSNGDGVCDNYTGGSGNGYGGGHHGGSHHGGSHH